MPSEIEWTEETWNPIVGCTEVSEGCRNCYAATFAHRALFEHHRGLTQVSNNGVHWNGKLRFLADALARPLLRGKPTRWFLGSMTDVGHDEVTKTDEGRRFLAAVYGVMLICSRHRFYLLTKRPENLRDWFIWISAEVRGEDSTWESEAEYCVEQAQALLREEATRIEVKQLTEPKVEHEADIEQLRAAAERIANAWAYARDREDGFELDGDTDRAELRRTIARARKDAGDLVAHEWPARNVVVGVTAENQVRADQRVPILEQLPAATRFVSYEPALGPLDIRRFSVDWLIAGGESGRRARPAHPDWFREVRDQCREAGVAFFFKQWGEHAPWVNEDWYTAEQGEKPSNAHVWITKDGKQGGSVWIHDADGSWSNFTGTPPTDYQGDLAPDVAVLCKIGKQAAGRLLDGFEYSEVPPGALCRKEKD